MTIDNKGILTINADSSQSSSELFEVVVTFNQNIDNEISMGFNINLIDPSELSYTINILQGPTFVADLSS